MTMPRLMMMLAGLALASTACGEETVRPAPVDAYGGAGGTTSTSSSSTGGQPPTGTPVRSVEMRNPWGDGPMDNHLVDGDFEHAISLQGQQLQAGWFNFNGSPGYVRGETGGACKSGLRCGVMENGDAFYGRGQAVRDGAAVAGIWVKPPPGSDCSVVTYDAVTCSTGNGAGEIPPVSPTPDESGWCEFRGSVSELSPPGCVYLEANLGPGEIALVDAAYIIRDSGAMTAQKTRAAPPGRAERARRAAIEVEKQRRFGRPERPKIPKY